MHTVTERNYYSGKPSEYPYLITQHDPFKIPQPPSIRGLINGGLFAMEISSRLGYLNELVLSATEKHKQGSIYQYFFTIEAVLLSMRKLIDDLTMTLYCLANRKAIEENRKIKVDGYGALFKGGKPTAFGTRVLEQIIHPHEEIAGIIAELSNSFKHSYLLAESRVWGLDFPTVVAIHAAHNDYSKSITYHNHSLGQLVAGFNLLVAQIISNADRMREDA